MIDTHRRAFIGVGSNEAASANIAAGLSLLNRQFGEVKCSSTFESSDCDGRDATYLNLVVEIRTELNWSELRVQLKSIEDQCGRQRGAGATGGAVTLDLDLLVLMGDPGIEDDFDLPLAELRTKSYLLAPLAELLPDWRHPDAGCSLAELWAESEPAALPLTRVGAGGGAAPTLHARPAVGVR